MHLRFALLLRARRRLLMPLDLKRPLSRSSSPAMQSEALRPNKYAKAQESLPTRLVSSMHPGSSRSGKASRSGGRGKGRGSGSQKKPKPHSISVPSLQEPIHDQEYIERTYYTKAVKPAWLENPKSPVANYCAQHLNKQPAYESTQALSPDGRVIWRTTVNIDGGEWNVTAHGDHTSRKDSERLAALSAMYQLDALGVFDKQVVSKREPDIELTPTTTKLSDGSAVNYERGRQFMDYYCRRFSFAKPEISYSTLRPRQGVTAWQAEMSVGGRRIGFGKGMNKKQAMYACYVDVTQYLEQCDPKVWTEFLQDARTGKDLGLAPRVLFQIDDALQDKVEDLCKDIKLSSLWKNASEHPNPQDAGAVAPASIPTEPRRPYRRVVSEEWLKTRSEELEQRRQAYLADPDMMKMRRQRAALPVYTKADELLTHIRENEVTICMAATGSGKTTQLPQLILDDMIARGEGAKCNIVCTQPRRIAAISVADRVAKERGERAGRGSSIGYQVRFESNLPDEHGSVTFCTTGIFLKRMQSALEGGPSVGRSLDDVTHVVVDEVHERDVDTDLLLVVLKRLLADRKARGKPIKVVLMSATIDPTLFQQYFPNEQGQPASVLDIPGRAFPVNKNFINDYVHELYKAPGSQWVFQEESVQKYLVQQMGSEAPVMSISRNPSRSATPISTGEVSLEEDLELPAPLIALTIAHVLKNSEDGHVLVFLPGWDDITTVQKLLTVDGRPLWGLDFNDQSKFKIHLLHSSVPVLEQQAIFEPPPPGIRRIILATNIAETSVTIPDVVYVVDSAKVKEQRYDPERHISSLVSAWVGSSNLNQRAGRAGRHRPGEYYGILSKKFADSLHPHQTVEMKRVDLSNVVMHVKALNFPGMTVEEVLAETIEPPPPDRVVHAMNALQMVGALDKDNNLTSLGRVLLQLPVDVQMGRLVLYGSFFRCLDQALTLAAILTNRDPFMAPMHLKTESAARKNSFSPEDFRSDALATLKAYNQWWDMQRRGSSSAAHRFLSENFLAKPTMLMIAKIKEHLFSSLQSIGVIDVSAGGVVSAPSGPKRGEAFYVPPELNRNGDSLPLLAALLAMACQPKFAIRTGERTYRTQTDKVVFIHPSSVNHRKREFPEQEPSGPRTEKQIIAYAEKRQNVSTGSSNPQKFLVTTSRLDPLTYILFGAYRIEVTARGLECDEWLPIIGRPDALDEVERLKGLMQACLLRVFEGIIAARTRMGRRPLPRRDLREEESEDEDEALRDRSLSKTEIKELDLMADDLVKILNDYSRYRIAMQSQHNSRPATPMDSPSYASSRLPSLTGTRSGYASTYNSRPSTPSRLSRGGGRW
ncbi:nucleoside triphosphate hydrolase protein [Wolfiporia cocos MD-104 SS10]|uniref:Nucleoside triphosphate hydrolase protein n=1 Tax=Wolfiporia cocos (strain MD-104) TaxID=742152 RepID=A0A2H3J7M2_WOLCO|nr:nucleoside triphosphate hydrolase protein [Wolfiporia cocos MD-104 SS10]